MLAQILPLGWHSNRIVRYLASCWMIRSLYGQLNAKDSLTRDIDSPPRRHVQGQFPLSRWAKQRNCHEAQGQDPANTRTRLDAYVDILDSGDTTYVL